MPRTFLSSWGHHECDAKLIDLISEADVVNLHHATHFICYKNLIDHIPLERPLVITLHDMLMFTGGCAYSTACNGFHECCDHCPQLKHAGLRYISSSNWKDLRQAYSTRNSENTRIVADSDWLANQARKSSLFDNFQVERIYYGLDTKVFKPRNKSELKNNLGLLTDKPDIGFGSVSVSNPRKGLDLLYAAMQILEIPVILLTWGHGRASSIPRHEVCHLGTIESEWLLSMVLGACDLFVIPSREEAFGQTALEAAACGIPCIGFNVGGVPEVVRDGECGWICPEFSADSLARTIAHLISQPKAREKLSFSARNTVLTMFSESVNAQNYLSLYADIAA